jgi:CheY-like chemotaxis protein
MIVTEPPSRANAMDATAPRPFRILVADDDRGNREALADLLRARGFDTVQAADGGEAVEIVRMSMVHLVFFDLHMPRLTGLEALQIVRQMNDLLPAILMTADATRDVMRQALAEKVHTVLPKPVSPNLALHAIAQALNKAYGQVAPPVNGTGPATPPAKGGPLVHRVSIEATFTFSRKPTPPNPETTT